ncbi:MaoC/PaaZ C-terminal domain-containing protein [Pseudovibrio exalbescens]|uniref:MaoC/PaaZ C-terminal domain-containing protein n=1 Tax=Pseudovibrio exalbescens TaxID=197461 RepID=UPI002366871C|nr:MaoC/PaaZ C-terminal domain-containing protein [Pseudovibrio exalbescens]MDD7908324.1 MaoC/PaaZ C-terminal domain-containing protein [Pseudovibrio exalbescens]
MAEVNATAEDFPVGEPIWTATATLSFEDCVTFAELYDPQPMHLDAKAAQESFFGTLVASGWQVLSLTMRLVVDAKPLGDRPLIGAELENIRILEPIKPGTKLQAIATTDQVITTKSGKRFALMSIKTVDADSKAPLVVQKWRMLLT